MVNFVTLPVGAVADPTYDLLGFCRRQADIYSGAYVDGDTYHILSTIPETLRKRVLADEKAKKNYGSVGENFIFEKANFTYRDLSLAMDSIMDELAKTNDPVLMLLDEKASTIIVVTNESSIKDFRTRVASAVDNIRSRDGKVSLYSKLVFDDAGDRNFLPEPTHGDKSTYGLDWAPSEVNELLVFDPENQVYAHSVEPAVILSFRGILVSVADTSYVLRSESFAPEGDIVIFLNDSTRYSYKLDTGRLNVNGFYYRISDTGIVAVKQILADVKESSALANPKWLSWMNITNITAITRYVSDGQSIPVPANMLKQQAVDLYRAIDVNSVERFDKDSIVYPTGSSVFKVVLSFKSRVTYTLIAKVTTLYIETSDIPTGLKYTMTNYTASTLASTFNKLI